MEAQRGDTEDTGDTYLDERYPGEEEHMPGFIPDRRPQGARHKNGGRHSVGTGVWYTDISRAGRRVHGVHSAKGERPFGNVREAEFPVVAARSASPWYSWETSVHRTQAICSKMSGVLVR